MGVSAFAQTPVVQTSTTATDQSSAAATTDKGGSYATGAPLPSDSKEGFWGHVNPLARKKWVHRQVDPIKDRTNELDQLQAKNANDIKDVDARSQAGINKAMLAANTADQHAMDANNRATAASQLAGTASTKTDALNTTVGNLDQYKAVTASTVPFAKGRTALGPSGKLSLDDFAAKLDGQKGYIIEVEGYSRSGVQTSQAMADAVVRYLVTEHQVPVYRIYRSGLGRDTATQGDEAIVNGVRVTVLHNSLADMNSTTASNSAPAQPSRSGVTAPMGSQ
jgi:outer membrane protein OmpA-like peptidoglycan-associated protein